MTFQGKIAVVTGGASGIGMALCERLHRAGAARVIVSDINQDGASAVAARVKGHAVACDVSDEAQVRELIERVENEHGPISIYCSNAGIATFDERPDDATSASNDAWARSWGINVMAHVYAARALAPRMAERSGGQFLITVSAAGLLSQIGGAAYATTKHAALGFAEALAIAHADEGIRVSALCPQGVDTPMLRGLPAGPQALDGVLSADDVAAAALTGMETGRFLILPHARVAEYVRRKAADHDRWIAGMIKLRHKMQS